MGHVVTLFEKDTEVGGVWAASRRYPGLTTQNVRSTYAFSDFPYPDDYPEVESIITASRNGLTLAEAPVLMRQRLSGHSSICRRTSAYYMLKVTLAMLVDAMREKVSWRES